MASEEGEMPPATAPPLEDDNLLSEILLRLPPQPSSLPRASAVCKHWHSLACNPGFCRRFRRHHRRNAPVLGFFDTNKFLPFVPTLDAPNRVMPARFSLVYDDRDPPIRIRSRHGLVLIFDEKHRHIVVWDPVTGDRYRIYIPPDFEQYRTIMIGVAVLRDAGDVYFRVVLVVGDNEDSQDRRALARVYSQETNLWGDLISMPLPPEACMTAYPLFIIDNAVLVGDSLYWLICGTVRRILEFNLERQRLDMIPVPEAMVGKSSERFSFIREEGELGCLTVSGFTAQLWKRNTDSDGVGSWVLGRTIELDKLLSLDPDEHEEISVRGFAEQNNMVFLSTVIGIFMLQLHSLQFTFMEHTETTDIEAPEPFESVYTAETRNKGPEEFDLSEQYIRWPE